MPRCQHAGCKSDAKKDSRFCKSHNNEQVVTRTESDNPANATVALQQHVQSVPQQPQLQLQQQVPYGQSLQQHSFQQQVLVVENPNTLQLLRQLQDENRRLMDENKQVQQLAADRLRFEEASKRAWEKVDELERVNRELRAENEQLKIRLAAVEARVSALEGDKLLIEVKELLNKFQARVVETLDPDAYFVSDLDLNDESLNANWRKACPTRDISVLKALRTALQMTAGPRNSVAHPPLHRRNAPQWMTTLQTLLTRKKPHEIETLVHTAMEWLDDVLVD